MPATRHDPPPDAVAAPLPPAVAARLGAPPYTATALGPRTTAWRGPAGAAVARRPGSARKAAQEAAALAAWGPACGGPALLHADHDAVWTAWLPGAPAAADSPPAVWAALGAACAGLDQGAAAPDPLPLDQALARRAAALGAGPWAPLLAGCDWSAWAGRVRWPQHRDLAPRNALVDGDTVRLVDFEHARADAPGADAARLWLELRLLLPPAGAEGAWAGWAEGRAAAGGPPLPGAAALRDLAALMTAGTLAWAARHDDAEFARRGQLWATALARGEGPPAA